MRDALSRILEIGAVNQFFLLASMAQVVISLAMLLRLRRYRSRRDIDLTVRSLLHTLDYQDWDRATLARSDQYGFLSPVSYKRRWTSREVEIQHALTILTPALFPKPMTSKPFGKGMPYTKAPPGIVLPIATVKKLEEFFREAAWAHDHAPQFIEQFYSSSIRGPASGAALARLHPTVTMPAQVESRPDRGEALDELRSR